MNTPAKVVIAILFTLIVAALIFGIPESFQGVSVFQSKSDMASLDSVNESFIQISRIDSSFVLSIAFVLIILLLVVYLVQVYFRGERWLLDWWIAPLLVAVLVYKDFIPGILYVILLTGSVVGTVIAVVFNKDKDVFRLGAFDFTTLMIQATLLIILYKAGWELVSYPSYIPIWLVVVIFIFSFTAEVLQSPLLGILSFLTGLVAGYTFNIWISVVYVLVIILSASLLSGKAWVKYQNSRFTEHTVFSDSTLKIIILWSIVMIHLVTFVLSALIEHGNIPLIQIG